MGPWPNLEKLRVEFREAVSWAFTGSELFTHDDDDDVTFETTDRTKGKKRVCLLRREWRGKVDEFSFLFWGGPLLVEKANLKQGEITVLFLAAAGAAHFFPFFILQEESEVADVFAHWFIFFTSHQKSTDEEKK